MLHGLALMADALAQVGERPHPLALLHQPIKIFSGDGSVVFAVEFVQCAEVGHLHYPFLGGRSPCVSMSIIH